MLSITINITSRRTHKGETDIHMIVCQVILWQLDQEAKCSILCPHGHTILVPTLSQLSRLIFVYHRIKEILESYFALRFQNLTWAHSIKVNRKIYNWGKIYYFYNILFWYNVITLVHCFLTLFLQTCHLAWDAHTLMWFTDWLGNSSPVREPQLNLVPNTPSFQL